MALKSARDIEKTYARAHFVAKLRRLADALEEGRPVVITVGGERVKIPRNAVLSIEHEREGRSEELEFQLTWQRPVRGRRR